MVALIVQDVSKRLQEGYYVLSAKQQALHVMIFIFSGAPLNSYSVLCISVMTANHSVEEYVLRQA